MWIINKVILSISEVLALNQEVCKCMTTTWLYQHIKPMKQGMSSQLYNVNETIIIVRL